MKTKVHIINLVYGDENTKTFLNISLKSQLTSENLIYLAKQNDLDVIYKIYTNKETFKLLENSTIYIELSKLINTQLIIVPTEDSKFDKVMNKCHKISLSKALEEDAALIYLSSDMICSNNMYKSLYDFLIQGYRSVLISSIRISKQSFVRYLKSNNKRIDFSPRELVKITLNHIHPSSKALFYNSKKMSSSWSSDIYWKIDSSNLLVRSFIPQPLLLWPNKEPNALHLTQNLTQEYNISLEKTIVVTNSDTLFVNKLTDEKLFLPSNKLINQIDQHISNWCDSNNNPQLWTYINCKIYFKSENRNATWKSCEKGSDKVIDSISKLFHLKQSSISANHIRTFIVYRILSFAKRKVSSFLYKYFPKSHNFLKKVKKKMKINYLKKLKNKVKSFLIRIRNRCSIFLLYYESKIAPFLAKHFYLIFWPIYKILKLSNLRFIFNIGGGVGHTIIELDNFFRKKHLKIIDPDKKYILLRKSCVYSKTVAKLYNDKFSLTIVNDFWYLISLPILIKYKDLTVDVGLSRLKWQLTDKNKYYTPLQGQAYLYQLSKKDGIDQYANYFKMRQKTSNFDPLRIKSPHDSKLIKFIGGLDKKIALVQIKEQVINATAKETDPNTYLKAFDYLQKLDYKIILVGREKMPEIFKKYSVINYSESNLTSFENDIRLFNLASLALISGSGLAFLGDCINLPYLYLNAWTLQLYPPSHNCIFIPTLVKKKNGKILTFSEQINLYDSLADKGAEVFPANEYAPINASSDDILYGIKELLEKINPKNTSLQMKMKEKHYLLPYNDAKFSYHFLEKNKNLI